MSQNHKPMKRVRATTKAYITHLARLQYQIETAKGSGLTAKDCLLAVLKDLNISIWTPTIVPK